VMQRLDWLYLCFAMGRHPAGGKCYTEEQKRGSAKSEWISRSQALQYRLQKTNDGERDQQCQADMKTMPCGDVR
jgi:hypothetical protein